MRSVEIIKQATDEFNAFQARYHEPTHSEWERQQKLLKNVRETAVGLFDKYLELSEDQQGECGLIYNQYREPREGLELHMSRTRTLTVVEPFPELDHLETDKRFSVVKEITAMLHDRAGYKYEIEPLLPDCAIKTRLTALSVNPVGPIRQRDFSWPLDGTEFFEATRNVFTDCKPSAVTAMLQRQREISTDELVGGMHVGLDSILSRLVSVQSVELAATQ